MCREYCIFSPPTSVLGGEDGPLLLQVHGLGVGPSVAGRSGGQGVVLWETGRGGRGLQGRRGGRRLLVHLCLEDEALLEGDQGAVEGLEQGAEGFEANREGKEVGEVVLVPAAVEPHVLRALQRDVEGAQRGLGLELRRANEAVVLAVATLRTEVSAACIGCHLVHAP